MTGRFRTAFGRAHRGQVRGCSIVLSQRGGEGLRPCNTCRWVGASAGDADKESPAELQQQPSDAPLATSASNGQDLRIPRDVIEKLRSTVFGFDTFFVTGVDNYEADGVLFQGNLRGTPEKAFQKMQDRLRANFGEDFALFLLEDKTSKPVVAVFPSSFLQQQSAPVAEGPVAALFALATLVTILNASGVPLLPAVLGADVNVFDPEYLLPALPGTLATIAILAAHESGHIAAAKREGATLSPPFVVPAGLGIIGSFGGVTNIRSTLRDRTSLLRIAAAGPAAGTAASAACVVVGLVLTVAGVGGGAQIESVAFNDSLLMGFVGKAVFGDTLANQASVVVHPLVAAGWAGLVINGLNLIPAGELDGARIAHGLWGRRSTNLISAVLVIVLGLLGFVDTLALYWILLLLTLQRGPIQPQQDELSAPSDSVSVGLGAGLLFVPLLALLPFPGDVTSIGF